MRRRIGEKGATPRKRREDLWCVPDGKCLRREGAYGEGGKRKREAALCVLEASSTTWAFVLRVHIRKLTKIGNKRGIQEGERELSWQADSLGELRHLGELRGPASGSAEVRKKQQGVKRTDSRLSGN